MVDSCENLEWKDGKARWDWTKPYFILAKQPNKSKVLPNNITIDFEAIIIAF